MRRQHHHFPEAVALFVLVGAFALLSVVAAVAFKVGTNAIPVLLVLLAIWGLTAWAVALERHRRMYAGQAEDGLCRECGYDLRASPGRCPECGVEPAADGKSAIP